MAMREIVLDPDGDVRLQLQDSPDDTSSDDAMTDANNQDAPEPTSAHLGILVSSKILCNASTVFRTMLGPGGQFKEASELAQNQASSTIYTLELPEDNAEAALVWCSFLHAKTKNIPKKPSAWFLKELATFAFKYDCVEIMEYPGKVWLGALHQQISQRIFSFDLDESLYDDGLESLEELCQCLYFAYTVDLPEEYASIAGSLVKVEGGDGISSPYRFLDGLDFSRDVGGMYNRTTWTLPEWTKDADTMTLGTLDNLRKDCIELIHKNMMEPFFRPWESLAGGNHCAAKTLGMYADALRRHGIWPKRPGFIGINLQSLIRGAEALGRSQDITLSMFRCEEAYNCPCHLDSNESLTKKLVDTCGRLEHLLAGRHDWWVSSQLCLDCLRDKGKEPKATECKLHHQEPDSLFDELSG
jgi:hypothetical protein